MNTGSLRLLIHSALLVFLLTVFSYCSKKRDALSENNIGEANLDYETRIKIRQYVSQGRILYQQHCSNCHQADGEGLASLYPPVKNADYFMKDIPGAICYIRSGLKGEIWVNGVVFNQEMPANNTLSDLELAEIVTYVVNELNDSTALISQKQVRRLYLSCAKDQ